jgi:predicted transposase/invertase (TIGR01784 family)
LEEGRKQGLEEGEAIGMKKATEAIIRNARQNGLSIEQIQAFTGLSETDIENVISKPG